METKTSLLRYCYRVGYESGYYFGDLAEPPHFKDPGLLQEYKKGIEDGKHDAAVGVYINEGE